MKRLRSAVIEAILIQFGHAKSLDYDKLKTVVLSVDISDFAKKEMLDRLRFIVDSLSAHEDINDRYDCYYESLLHLSGTVGVFSSGEGMIVGQEENTDAVTAWHRHMIGQIRRLFIFQNDNAYEFLFKRLLYGMGVYSTNTSYAELYRVLYGKE